MKEIKAKIKWEKKQAKLEELEKMEGVEYKWDGSKRLKRKLTPKFCK